MSPLHLLIVEDNPGDARLIQAYLDDGSGRFEFVHVDRLSRAIEKLRDGLFDAVLLDLSLPDAQGIDTFLSLHRQHAGVPILVLTGLDDESVAVCAVEHGAQDYLVKGAHLEPLLARAIRYAVERHRLQAELRGLAIIDGVTGLYNDRGFLIVAQQSLRLVQRLGKVARLGILEVEVGGEAEAENLWRMELAEKLRASFDEADVVARIGESRFAVLVTDHDAGAAMSSLERFRSRISAWAASVPGLSVRFGAAAAGDERPVSDLVAEAEADGRKAGRA